MFEIDFFIRGFAISQLALIVSLTLVAYRDNVNARLLSGLCISGAAYLLVSPLWFYGEKGWLLWFIVAINTQSALFIFLLSTRLFPGLWGPKVEKATVLSYLVLVLGVLSQILPPVDPTPKTEGFFSVMLLGMGLMSLAAVLKDWKVDLVEPRRKIRLAFFIVLSMGLALPAVTSVAGTALFYRFGAPGSLIDGAMIALIALLFNLSHLRGRSDSPWNPTTPKLQPVVDVEKLENLNQLIQQKKVYREEGLTVSGLSKRLGVSQHQLRTLINGPLGFDNFNDFLNRHRVHDAGEMLVNGDQKILDIAYEVGFSSLAPFNRAFKKVYTITPSEFRKQGPTVSEKKQTKADPIVQA